MVEPTIQEFEGALLCGIKIPMELRSFNPERAWALLMPQLHKVTTRTSEDLISLRDFDVVPVFGPEANPSFSYWAAVEVTRENIHFEQLEIPKGTYAVFNYKGLSTDHSIWRYIYGTWMASSPYTLDNRPHFERLGARYKNNDPSSEEEIWIPITEKSPKA
jgi:AraC family transcriptional regulator